METKVCTNPNCSHKGESQSFSAFYRDNTKAKDGYTYRCKDCLREATADYAKKHREQRYANARKWAEKHPERVKENRRKWLKEHREQFKETSRKWNETHREQLRNTRREYYLAHKEEAKKSQRKNYLILKSSIMAAYGGSVCACCGETDIRFLTIDHVDGDGAQHRKLIGGGGNTYKWLRQNGYPSGFQVLCYNCNMGRYRNGGICPHNDPNNEEIKQNAQESS